MTNQEHAGPAALQPGAPAGGGRSRRREYLTIAAAIGAMAVVGSIVYAMAGTAGTTGSTIPTGGGDSRTDLFPNMSVIVQTEDKAVVQVKIREVDAAGLGFTATIAGLPTGEAGTWTAILEDDSEVPMRAWHLGDSVFRVELEGQASDAESVDEVRLDPDASDGEIYFTIP